MLDLDDIEDAEVIGLMQLCHQYLLAGAWTRDTNSIGSTDILVHPPLSNNQPLVRPLKKPTAEIKLNHPVFEIEAEQTHF